MFFDQVGEAPPDPIFGLAQAFKADVRKEKVNLVVGIYYDEHLRAELLSSARAAKTDILSQDLMADYLPIDGLHEMIELLGPLVFGDQAWSEHHGRIYAAHTTGGTGALRVGAEFLAKEIGKSFYVPNHTWPNHRSILERAGCQFENYPYYSREKRGFDFEAMAAFLGGLKEKSIVILHACCHNPTGCDPSLEQWKEISRIMKEKRLLPFFDFAYQGLGDGLEKDADAVRVFLKDGHEMLIAYSCSKNFSMYCQRVGVLFIVDENSAIKTRVGSQIKRIIRALYSNPPAHGARIVREILKRDDLRKVWLKDLESIRRRIHLMRETLIQRLISKAKGIDFGYLKGCKGMFSFIDMDRSQVQKMIDEFAIYMTDNGRI
ncbi:aromatic amino acid transaminase, partial [bacterium]|nr:aromatic amino acid transaminase [bacterium]